MNERSTRMLIPLPLELWIVEPSDGRPTQAFTTRQGTGAYMARIAGPFKLAHWKRVGDGSEWRRCQDCFDASSNFASVTS